MSTDSPDVPPHRGHDAALCTVSSFHVSSSGLSRLFFLSTPPALSTSPRRLGVRKRLCLGADDVATACFWLLLPAHVRWMRWADPVWIALCPSDSSVPQLDHAAMLSPQQYNRIMSPEQYRENPVTFPLPDTQADCCTLQDSLVFSL